MVPVVPGLLIAIALVVVGEDLGTALVLVAILLGMLWVVGAPMRLFVAVLLDPRRRRDGHGQHQPRAAHPHHRRSWIRSRTTTGRAGSPSTASTRCRPAGCSARASAPASRSGATCPRRTPTSSSRCSARSSGLAGTLLVVGLFLTIAFAAVRVARRTADPFVRYATFGVIVWLLGQMIINVGMVLALLPVIGIPLPLVSYGGSALLPSLVALGLLVGFARREPEAARALAQRKQQRSAGLSAGRPVAADLRVRLLLSEHDAHPPRRRRHRRPHLAVARDGRCAAPSRARRARSPASARRAAWRTGSSPRPATRSSSCRRSRCRARSAATCQGARPAAGRRRGDPGRPRPGAARRGRRLRRLRVRARLPRGPPGQAADRRARAERAARARQQGSARGSPTGSR